MARIGILHPGQMGIVVAISAKSPANEVRWASQGRSAASVKRASDAGLLDAESLEALCGTCEMIVSVCPPDSAEKLASDVAATGFRGIYVDANAIAPERVCRIARSMEPQGIDFVDGGIIGLPSLKPGRTWLHLSGKSAERVAQCFAAGPMTVDVMGEEVGKASALKMCFAAWSKGSTALACAFLAAAGRHGVFPDLARQLDRIGPGMAKLEDDILRAAPKAWRFSGEMHEIAATLESAGMPPGFHEAAAEIYDQLRDFKDATPSFEQILRKLTADVHGARSDE